MSWLKSSAPSVSTSGRPGSKATGECRTSQSMRQVGKRRQGRNRSAKINVIFLDSIGQSGRKLVRPERFELEPLCKREQGTAARELAGEILTLSCRRGRIYSNGNL